MSGGFPEVGKITDNEYATYFWQGIPKPLHTCIENRILARNPIRDLSQPFGSEEIDTAAEVILQRDRFDRVMADTDSEEDDESSGDEELSESEDKESDEESEGERRG